LIRVKSVHSPIDRSKDGLRILATRYQGRFVRTTRYDVWMPNLAPSEDLLKGSGEMPWRDFIRRFRAELLESGGVDKHNRTIKNRGQKFTLRLLQKLARKQTITLMCHCAEDRDHCHRHVLKKMLDSKL
jgi:uncharacterized protein YeaO (DUF488 family)